MHVLTTSMRVRLSSLSGTFQGQKSDSLGPLSRKLTPSICKKAHIESGAAFSLRDFDPASLGSIEMREHQYPGAVAP